jgi:hypothetical protein
MSRRRSFLSLAVLCTALAVACGDDTPTSPSPVAVATFAVGSESVRVAMTSADQVAAARAAQNGGAARIPVGRIVPGTQVNSGWSWHPEDQTFAEVTIELCDGRPFRCRARRQPVRRRTFLSVDGDRGSKRLGEGPILRSN